MVLFLFLWRPFHSLSSLSFTDFKLSRMVSLFLLENFSFLLLSFLSSICCIYTIFLNYNAFYYLEKELDESLEGELSAAPLLLPIVLILPIVKNRYRGQSTYCTYFLTIGRIGKIGKTIGKSVIKVHFVFTYCFYLFYLFFYLFYLFFPFFHLFYLLFFPH